MAHPEPRSPLPTAHKHWPVLDGLRGVAVLLVFLDHACRVQLGTLLDKLIYNLSLAGWIGVDLFLVLSGFLITGILFDSKASSTYFRSFYARRSLRIFPLYFGFLALIIGVATRIPGLAAVAPARLRDEQVYFWTYTSNFYYALSGTELPPTLGVFWTLAIEEHFYLIWPLVVFAFERRVLLAISVAVALASLGLRGALALAGTSLDAIFLMTPCRLDELAIGAAFALALRSPWYEPAKFRRFCGALGATSACVVAALFVMQGNAYHDSVAMTTLGLTGLGLAFASLLVLAISADPASWLARVAGSSILRTLGLYSYGIYVLHTLVIGLVHSYLFTPRDLPKLAGSEIIGHIAFVAVCGAATLALAALSYHGLESRLLALKRFFPMSPPSG